MRFKPTNYLLRHLQTMLYSLGRLWRQPIASLMTITVIAIALALPAGLYVLLHNVEQVSDRWDSNSQLTLFLQQDSNEQQAQQLMTTLATWPEIVAVDYQSAEQSLKEFEQTSGLTELLKTLPSNPLPAVISIKVQDKLSENAINQLVERLQTLVEVEQAQLDMAWLQRLRMLNKTAQRGIAILAILLSLSVLLIIGNTIRLAILSRESEIRVIKLVGGTDTFIRRPFLYTGFWYGLLGGIVAWSILLGTLSLLSGPINDLAALYNSQFTLYWLAPVMLLILSLTGAILGAIGAALAVNRHLHLIEPS